jgi:hypothetical protein
VTNRDNCAQLYVQSPTHLAPVLASITHTAMSVSHLDAMRLLRRVAMAALATAMIGAALRFELRSAVSYGISRVSERLGLRRAQRVDQRVGVLERRVKANFVIPTFVGGQAMTQGSLGSYSPVMAK